MRIGTSLQNIYRPKLGFMNRSILYDVGLARGEGRIVQGELGLKLLKFYTHTKRGNHGTLEGRGIVYTRKQ